MELGRDDVQGVNVRMHGEALVPCGWGRVGTREWWGWALGSGRGLGEACGALKGRGPRCEQQGPILGATERTPLPCLPSSSHRDGSPRPAGRQHLPRVSCPGGAVPSPSLSPGNGGISGNRSQTGNFCVPGPPSEPFATHGLASAAGWGAQGRPHLPWQPWVSHAFKGGASTARLQALPVLRLSPGAERQHRPARSAAFGPCRQALGGAWAPRPGCRRGWDYSPGAQSSVVRGLPAA